MQLFMHLFENDRVNFQMPQDIFAVAGKMNEVSLLEAQARTHTFKLQFSRIQLIRTKRWCYERYETQACSGIIKDVKFLICFR